MPNHSVCRTERHTEPPAEALSFDDLRGTTKTIACFLEFTYFFRSKRDQLTILIKIIL